MNVGIIGFQGDVQEHALMIRRLGRKFKDLRYILVRRISDLEKSDGLIIPGGESTTIYKLITEYGLYDEIVRRVKNGMPLMATCAGLIIVSRETNDPRVKGMGLIDTVIKRNGYGRQVNSFEAEVQITGIGDFPAVFIRAPIIEDHGKAEVLGEFDGRPVIVRQDNVLAMTFHPELTGDTRIHEYFMNMAMGRGGYISTARS